MMETTAAAMALRVDGIDFCMLPRHVDNGGAFLEEAVKPFLPIPPTALSHVHRPDYGHKDATPSSAQSHA